MTKPILLPTFAEEITKVEGLVLQFDETSDGSFLAEAALHVSIAEERWLGPRKGRHRSTYVVEDTIWSICCKYKHTREDCLLHENESNGIYSDYAIKLFRQLLLISVENLKAKHAVVKLGG